MDKEKYNNNPKNISKIIMRMNNKNLNQMIKIKKFSF